MKSSKSVSLNPAQEGDQPDTRARIIDAAERLLRAGKTAEFSMRELASEAGVSFATPFNQFGSKIAIMRALSARRIDAMHQRFAASGRSGNAVQRAMAAVDIAAGVMLAEPIVSRAVMGAIGAAGGEPGNVWHSSCDLWAEALAGGDGLAPAMSQLALAQLPDHLAFAFRGVLSFWTAGEIADQDFVAKARLACAVALLGFVEGSPRQALLEILGKHDTPRT